MSSSSIFVLMTSSGCTVVAITSESVAAALDERGAHLAQAPHALLDRRVGREELRDATARERLDDVERLRGLVDLHRDRLGALLEPQQRARQGLGVAGDLGAG